MFNYFFGHTKPVTPADLREIKATVPVPSQREINGQIDYLNRCLARAVLREGVYIVDHEIQPTHLVNPVIDCFRDRGWDVAVCHSELGGYLKFTPKG